ncbi:MAG: HNH endonuclease [Selenomonadaceae bacterium]|nr:HNH endonuclease [Selenomonadaceae bacterium]
MRHKEKLFKLLRECVETPQESFAVEEMISKIEGTMPKIEIVDKNTVKCSGLKFSRNKTKRFTCTVSLYRFIWTYFNGEIPEGYEIHHRDFNHDNNDISNLQLLPKTEHRQLHQPVNEENEAKKNAKYHCAVCGKEFKSRRGKLVYCSAECRRSAEKTRATKTKICEMCGKEFSTTSDARFCSRKCVGESLKKQETKICPICGKTFSDIVSNHRKYCSVECANESYRKNVMRTCLNCGKEFSIGVTRNQKFCCRECFHEYGRETKTCPICGKEFTVKKSSCRKYCSRRCAGIASHKK